MEKVFIYLSKFLPVLIYPAGLIFMLLLIGFLFHKKRKVMFSFFGIAFFVLLVTGNPFPAAFMTRALEKAYPAFDQSKKVEVIVVLGGGTESLEAPRQIVEIGGAGDRILYAAHLYHHGFGQKILFGGAYYALLNGGKPSVAEEMAMVAMQLGVKKDDILLQPESLNTYEEAVADAKLLREMGVTQVILVTSATHMKRAVGAFTKQGLRVIPAPTDYSYSDAEWENLIRLDWGKWYTWIIPQAGNMRSLETALKEYVGILVYRLRGWID